MPYTTTFQEEIITDASTPKFEYVKIRKVKSLSDRFKESPEMDFKNLDQLP